MKIKPIYQKCILLIAVFLLCMIPQTVKADTTNTTNTTTTTTKEYSFNKKKNITIKDSESYASTSKYTWISYKPSADGYLTVTVSNPEGAAENAKGYIALYDSTKARLLSSKSIFYNMGHSNNAYWYQFSFGMQKGQTYYFRIKSENAVNLSRKYTKTNDKSGAARATALTLKKNKAKKGLIPAGTSNADWYKITLKKKQKLKLYYTAKTNGAFKLSVYSGTKLIGTKNIYYTAKERKITLYQYIKSTKKTTGMNPGEYYIKIERANTTSSGYYKIKWK